MHAQVLGTWRLRNKMDYLLMNNIPDAGGRMEKRKGFKKAVIPLLICFT
ncbi:MAG: hypothetical protein ABI688_01015 [Bacteroidota bacterium]